MDFSGSLQITKGNDINMIIQEGFLPANIRSGLELAARHHSCRDMRKVANDVTATLGSKACIH